jgi:hypothetical protein
MLKKIKEIIRSIRLAQKGSRMRKKVPQGVVNKLLISEGK